MIYLYYQIKLISLGLKGLHITSLYPQFWMKDPTAAGKERWSACADAAFGGPISR